MFFPYIVRNLYTRRVVKKVESPFGFLSSLPTTYVKASFKALKAVCFI